ncbi:MAG: hypothetical protein IJU51_03000, partial [Clostridia bacterium]|nr:hypothetical protein [Clostridia bacterium]
KWSAKDDEELAQLLNEGKINAEKMLKESYNRNDYEKDQLKEIDAIIKKYMERINEASKASEINDLYAQAVAEIQLIKTKSQVSAENEASKKAIEESKKQESEEALNQAKESAAYELRVSVAGNEYHIAEYNKVQDLLDKYINNINNAKTVQEVNKLKAEGLKELAKIKTVEESSNESSEEESSKPESSKPESSEQESSKPESSKPESSEEESSKPESSEEESSKPESSVTEEEKLNNYRKRAIASINSYMDIDSLSSENQAAAKAVIASYTYYINNSDDYGEIDEYVDLAKDKLADIYDSDQSQPESSEPVESSKPDENSENQQSENETSGD